MTRFLANLAIACAVVLPFSFQAVGLAQSPFPSTPTLETTPLRSTDPSTAPTAPTLEPQSQTIPNSEDAAITCAANEFASKFPDVTPNDWAYEAVNRVASGEIRCFPISGQVF